MTKEIMLMGKLIETMLPGKLPKLLGAVTVKSPASWCLIF